MNAEQTPEPMMTGRSCMKVVGRLSELSLLMLSGKRSMRNGQRDQQRKLVMLRLLRVRKRVVKKAGDAETPEGEEEGGEEAPADEEDYDEEEEEEEEEEEV